jgi:hypothetical protein
MKLQATKVEREFLEMMLDTFLDHYGNWDRSHNPYKKTLKEYNDRFGEIFTEETLDTFKSMIALIRKDAKDEWYG